jgi:hypothetical protein
VELRSEVVRLNVGGVVYVTTAATLRSRGENFFTGLLDRSREWATHGGDGALFVDRNGHHFGPVLDFLRTGRLVVPPGMDRSAVEAECNFYLIELPADARPQHLDKWDTCVLQWRVQTRRVCDTHDAWHDTHVQLNCVCCWQYGSVGHKRGRYSGGATRR